MERFREKTHSLPWTGIQPNQVIYDIDRQSTLLIRVHDVSKYGLGAQQKTALERGGLNQ